MQRRCIRRVGPFLGKRTSSLSSSLIIIFSSLVCFLVFRFVCVFVCVVVVFELKHEVGISSWIGESSGSPSGLLEPTRKCSLDEMYSRGVVLEGRWCSRRVWSHLHWGDWTQEGLPRSLLCQSCLVVLQFVTKLKKVYWIEIGACVCDFIWWIPFDACSIITTTLG